jgi:bacillithiol synthase
VSANLPELTSLAGEAPVRVSVDVRRFPWIRKLTADYVYNFPAVARFFAGDPADPKAWSQAIARSQAHSRDRAGIAAVVAAQQARRGAPDAARAAAARLSDASSVAVVTGQQAGLFGGPLFTLLKALTAVKLAERVTRDHGVPCIAIFWVDAEDHDWNEVRSCAVLDQALASQSVALPGRNGDDPAPVATVILDDSVGAVADELERRLPDTEFRTDVMTALRRAYAPGVRMVDGFSTWLEHVLGPRGLVVYDASDAGAKPLASRVFAHELSAPGETSRLAAAGLALTAQGYHAQVQPQPDAVALFHLNTGRRSIRVQNGGLVVGDDRRSPEALRQEAVEHPDHFSPNVLLRPIVQDTVFPTVCYVAGPSELAYLGQLRDVYEHFGVPMPLIYPRATATLLDSAAMRFLGKYDVALEQLQAQDDGTLNELLRAQIPERVEAAFSTAGRAIEAQMAALIEAIPAIDPTLEQTARSTLSRMQHDLQSLHGKMISAAKRRDETLRRQFTRTRALAFPDGHSQERAVGFVSFLNQYGQSLIDRLDAQLPLDLGRHWILTV